MVEIFKTNVNSIREARILLGLFRFVFPKFQVNFDLSDVDRILRIESGNEPIRPMEIIDYLNTLGYAVRILED